MHISWGRCLKAREITETAWSRSEILQSLQDNCRGLFPRYLLLPGNAFAWDGLQTERTNYLEPKQVQGSMSSVY